MKGSLCPRGDNTELNCELKPQTTNQLLCCLCSNLQPTLSASDFQLHKHIQVEIFYQAGKSIITSVLHYGDTLHSHAAHFTLKQLHAVYDSALRVFTGDKYQSSVRTV